MLRSVGAIIAGYVTTVVLTIMIISGLGAVLPESLNSANTGWVIANIIYGAIVAGIGGYVTAFIAQKAELKHALILAGIMLVFGIMSFVAAMPTLEETGQPVWYYPVLMLTSTPAVVLGGYFRAQQKPQRKQKFA